MKRLASVVRTTVSPVFQQSARALSIHEFAAKKLLNDFGARVEEGYVCESIDDVAAACKKIKSDKIVVKSQILAGGRGKGTFECGFQGGVHVCDNPEKAVEVAKKMLFNCLVTKQTGGKGVKVNRLYVTEAIPNIKRELYLALILDRKTCCPTFIGSKEGGMGIEELAAKYPEKIRRLPVNVHHGIDEKACIKFAEELGFEEVAAEQAVTQLTAIYNLAKSKDATMVEINPLVELNDASIMCIDAKMSFDDFAQYRQPDIWALEDRAEKDPKEILADEVDLNYIALDGDVGCLVNGAGLAMATMDIISLYGKKPANFLDVGGSARTEQIVRAFEIISSDAHVKVILVNIFGGIMKCDLIASGIVEAMKVLKGKFNLPLVVRLQGTNDEIGKKILKDSGLPIHAFDDLDSAAKKATELV